jgi:hypothetical protein
MQRAVLTGRGLAAAMACAVVMSVTPVDAQIDLTGSWASRLHEDYIERGPGSDLGDYTGLPLSDAGRTKALEYDPTRLSMIERQCLPWSPWSGLFRPLGMRLWNETAPDGRIVAWKMSGDFLKDVLTIWMDGRPHPSANAFHPSSGFTTGVWEGDTLTTYTTHLKASTTRRGNGIPSSDRVTVTAHLTRHEDLLTVTLIQEDPIYLTEPYVVTRTWQLDPRGNLLPFNSCHAVTEIPRLEDSGIVPHYLPGDNPATTFMARSYGVPQEAAMGHAVTLYPEYRKQIAKSYRQPPVCTRYCCGWIEAQGHPEAAPNLSCITNGSSPVSRK